MKDSIERSVIEMEVPWFQTPNAIFDLKSKLDIYQKIIYLYLCRCGNQGATAFPSYQVIADKCGMSKRKAIDSVKKLIEYNLLYKKPRYKENGESNSNVYVVNHRHETWKVESSAQDAPPKECTTCTGVVHDMHPSSAQDAPKKEPSKNKNINNNIYITLTSNGDERLFLYNSYYKAKFNKEHMKIKDSSYIDVEIFLGKLDDFGVEIEDFEDAVKEHFSKLPKSNNGNILAFIKASKRYLEIDPEDPYKIERPKTNSKFNNFSQRKYTDEYLKHIEAVHNGWEVE